ncbi:MAG: Trm112 family protein [Acidimicrobiia bacterium]
MRDLIAPELLAIMQCVRCAGRLEPQTEPPSLLCTGCGLRYPVVDGVPVMLLEEAVETRS